MPHPPRKKRSKPNASKNQETQAGTRYTVGLAPAIARDVQHYARHVDLSMSKAIAALVRIGLDTQEERKREFFRKLKANLNNDDPDRQDQLLDEFRTLILGR